MNKHSPLQANMFHKAVWYWVHLAIVVLVVPVIMTALYVVGAQEQFILIIGVVSTATAIVVPMLTRPGASNIRNRTKIVLPVLSVICIVALTVWVLTATFLGSFTSTSGVSMQLPNGNALWVLPVVGLFLLAVGLAISQNTRFRILLLASYSVLATAMLLLVTSMFAQSNGIAILATPTATPGPTETAQEAISAVSTITEAVPVSGTISGASVSSAVPINVRSGPGVAYPLITSLDPDKALAIAGKSTDGAWWKVALDNGETGWVLASLVTTNGDTSTVPIAANIPSPPPIAAAPSPDISLEATPTVGASVQSPNAERYFKVVSSRLFTTFENGECLGKRTLRINVIDANGMPLDGVRLKGIPSGEEIVTGSQGKGHGVVEYVLNGIAEGFTIIKNDDGRDAISDLVGGRMNQSNEISTGQLIAGGYCMSEVDCQIYYDAWQCNGGWEFTFQRSY